jgi:hypothetical protein
VVFRAHPLASNGLENTPEQSPRAIEHPPWRPHRSSGIRFDPVVHGGTTAGEIQVRVRARPGHVAPTYIEPSRGMVTSTIKGAPMITVGRYVLLVTMLLLPWVSEAQPRPIHEDRFVRIGGIEQWVTIRGADRDNPVLLLHGGPGDTQSPLASVYTPIEHDFVLVQWDQRGAGKTLARANGAEQPVSPHDSHAAIRHRSQGEPWADRSLGRILELGHSESSTAK